MLKKGLLILSATLCSLFNLQAQVTDSDSTKVVTTKVETPKSTEPATSSDVKVETPKSVGDLPVISYDAKREYEIADIKITGLKNSMYEDHVLIGFSGLYVGDKIDIPGDQIDNAMKRYWKQGLFSDVKILATKTEGNKIWLEIEVVERPRISDILYSGMKKSERQDLEAKLGVERGLQITPYKLDRANTIIKKYFDDKGFNKAEIKLTQTPDLSKENFIILNVDVLKKNKTKVNIINIEGNKEVSETTLEKAMKKTRHKSNLKAWIRNFLRSTNYIPEGYETDKEHLLEKYNELGYRDARIIWDTVYTDAKKTSKVNVDLKVEEGKQYHIRDIKWVGNTEYPTWQLQTGLNMKGGDVYNQKKLVERLSSDDDAVMNYFYQNNGYVFSQADPVEISIDNDSIDLEIRIQEGRQATIRRVSISGNDRLYEDVIRRELQLKPGELYSRDAIMRSLREIMQSQHFDPEALQPDIVPDPEAGVVDVSFPLVSKANDQIEFSAGWGQTGVIGRLSLKFSNFSIKNLLNPSSYKGILPQGEGQTLTLSGQTNGRFYQSYSVSFFDPWFGGKRPNSLSVGAHFSKQTDVYSRYANNLYNSYGGYGGYGGGYSTSDMGYAADPDKSFIMLGLSAGYGKRLNWPDDYFHFQAELAYQLYKMKDWRYFVVKDGSANSISLNLSLTRSTIDNPTYTRRGSEFSTSLEITPPFSAWDGKDYKNMERTEDGYESKDKFKWIEYHKWKLKSKVFIPLSSAKKTPVLMTRAEMGAVGYFNKHKKSPFGTFYMGGDGMSGYSSTYATETIGLRGYENGSLGSQASAYTRLALELRYPLILEPTSTIYLLTFAEAGNAWYNVKDINPFQLKRSAGIGARIFLPMIGLMGIDWAYGFDPLIINGAKTRNQSGSQFHFIIGQEF